MLRRSVRASALGFLLVLGGVFQLSGQSSIQVTSAVTTRLPIPGNSCTAPPAETNFLTTDNRVFLVFSYTGGASGDSGFVEWFDPNGSLYFTSNVQQASLGGAVCGFNYIGIYGFTPATEPGNWRVRLRVNGTEVFSRPFTISAPSASPLALVSNTTLPQATVGAPYSFTFQASGGTPPYKWSLSVGQAPPGLTLSTAGVLSGTPASAASYLMSLHVADSAGNALDRDIGLGVALPALQIGVGSLAFSYTQGATVPKPQTFVITSIGSALPIALTTDQSWLSALPSSSNTPATVTVTVQPQGLTPGSYQGNITILSNGSSTPQQSVAVSLAVLPAGAGTPGGIIRTVAGTDFTFTIPDGQPLNAPLGQVYGMALDSSGNLYAADYQNSVVVKIAPNGTASIVAGNGLAGFSGEGGAAVNASLNQAESVAVDRSGNLYIADTFNNRIRRVSAADGTITTIAGPGFGYGGDGGPAVNALLELPVSLVVDASGNLFFYDFGSARIRKIASNGQISTVAGNGRTGYSGEGAATSVATEVLNQMALDSAGNLYFGDQEHHVRKLTLAGQTVLVAGNGQAGFSGDNGPAVNAALEDPDGLAIDSSGNIYIADFNNGRIRVVNPSGTIVTYAGIGSSNIIDSGDNGPALKAGMNPIALAVGSSGLVYLADYSTTVIRRIDTAGTITTIAGNSEYRSAPDGTPAINAFFDYPEGLAFDRSGNLIVADFDSARIRKVTPSGSFSTIAGVEAPGCCGDGGPATAAFLDGPNSVAVDAQNNIYFTDSNNHRVRRIGTDGKITTVAGAGRDSDVSGSFGGDNAPAALAHLDTPSGLAFDTSGNLYIADTGNNVVRRVAPPTDGTGTISTFAGTPLKPGFSGDGTPATKALLNQPYGLAIDAAGNVYIADAGNNSVRMVSPGGVISTFAGNPKAGFSGDGGPAKTASLNDPVGLTLDPAGDLYILENSGNRIRQVTPAGIITTIAGTGTAGFSGDGGPSASAQIDFPYGSMAYQNGALYFTDTGNHRVRAISLGGTSAPSLSVSPASLSLTALSSGATTNKARVTVSSSSPGLPVQVTATTASGGAWLQVDTTSATCPATIGIGANPSGLVAGTYQGTVTIASPYASPSQVNIAVTFTVTAAATGHLSTDPSPLSFHVLNGASPVTSQIALSNSGSGNLSFTAAASTSAGGPWLAVTPSNGTVSASAPAALTITITPGSLAAGVYSASITLSSPDNVDPPLVIPVTLLVGNPVPIILVSQTGLTYQSVAGGGNPLSQDVAILNVGQGSMNWTATALTLSGNNWLSISPASGAVTTPFVSFSIATVSVNSSSLAPGNYFGQIQVRADGASNAPQTISVVLNVFGPGTALAPELRPSGLVFIGSKDNTPGSQTVAIANRGTVTFGYNSFKGTLSNINWITNTPVTGTVPVNFPTRMTVQPDLSARSPGVDRGAITVLFDDGSSQTVSVLSVVPPVGYTPSAEPERIRAAAALEPHASGSCLATQLLSQLTNPASAVSQVPLGQPVSLELHLADDCGNAVTDKYPASVKVSFSTGESGFDMQHSGNGKWTRTWQPKSTQPTTVTVQVNAFATSNGKILGAQFPITVTLSSAAQVPLVNPGGIQNAASYSSAPVVSPGGLIAIFGNQLADPNGQQPPPGPVPTSLGHTQVKLGDALLPLFYTSNSQLNAQVPFSLPVNSQQQLVVQYGNTLSVPAPVSVSVAQPAIYTQDFTGTGQGAIINGVTGIVADSKNPVHAGDVISIYCTGLGPVNPAVAEGVAASSTVLSQTTTPVTATVGGQTATVNFAGLAPSYIGLYQVNVVIPNGVTPGDNVSIVLTEGSQVSQPVTISVR